MDSNQLRQRWASVAGVRFPGENKGNNFKDRSGWSDEEKRVGSKIPKGWKTTSQLAEETGRKREALYSILHNAGVQGCFVGNRASGHKVWDPEGVAKVLKSLPPRIDEIPEGWCTTEFAKMLMGLENTRYAIVAKQEGIASKKVTYNGKTQYIWKIEDIQKTIGVREKRDIRTRNARKIACPKCGAKGSLMELTRGFIASRITGIYRSEDSYSDYFYGADYKHSNVKPDDEAEVAIECSVCNTRWMSMDDFMYDYTKKQETKGNKQ